MGLLVFTTFVNDFGVLESGYQRAPAGLQNRARTVAWIGTVGFAMVLTLVEMGLEWAAPEGLRGVLRPVIFTLAALGSTAMVMRASYRESAKFYLHQRELNQALEHQARKGPV